MHFCLIDRVLTRDTTSLTAIKHVSAAEEYLQDHFPTFPVLPGVMMLEAMVQAARALAPARFPPLVLGKVNALKFGAMVRPGDTIAIQVRCDAPEADQPVFKGEVRLVQPGQPLDADDLPRAASGRITLRPVQQPQNGDQVQIDSSTA